MKKNLLSDSRGSSDLRQFLRDLAGALVVAVIVAAMVWCILFAIAGRQVHVLDSGLYHNNIIEGHHD